MFDVRNIYGIIYFFIEQVMLIAFAALLLVSPAVAKPQVLVDYGYYSPASYVASYSSPLAYSYYPYAYSYSYPLAYY